MKKLALVTPLRDEIENLEKIISSIQAQTTPIFIWVIVENDSTDGSQEYLQKLRSVENVTHLRILNLNMTDTAYGLGTKYASVVSEGFHYLKKHFDIDSLDYVGILDGDVSIESDYYRKLTDAFEKDLELGITSGVIYEDSGKLDLSNENWVRGGCRIWKRECFADTGYQIEPAEDTISASRAILNGWKVYTVKSAKAISRQVSTRVNYGYYGYAAYFRGHSLFYAVLKLIRLTLKLELGKGIKYLGRYVKCLIRREPRIGDKEVRRFFKSYLLRKYSSRPFFGRK